MSLTPEQERAAYAAGSVSVTAGAGTGKTHMLAERYLYHLRAGFSPLEIVAVTFTEKAATELRSRIRQTVAHQAPEQFDWLAELEAAQISTFHALAARICQEHPEAAEVPADFSLQDDLEGPLWQAEQLDIALDKLPAELYQQVPYSIMQGAIATFLSDPLSAETALQRRQADWLPALESVRQNALDDLLNHSSWIEARNFLNSCMGPPGDKREEMRLTAIDAIAQVEAGDDIPSSLDAIAGLKFVGGSAKKWGSKDLFDDVKAHAEALRNLLKETLKAGLITLQITAVDHQVEAMLPTLQAAFDQVRTHLRAAKQRQRVLDFNDLEVHALKALNQPVVRDYYAQRWRVFLIDEFQDTNGVQGEFLALLTQQAILTLVGDEKQSIYGFRRADVQVFQDWRQRIQQTGGESVSLTKSFRTHKPLIQTINTLFAPILGDLHQDLEADRTAPHAAPHLEVFAVMPDGEHGAKPNIQQCRQVEAQHIGDLIEKLLGNAIEVWDKQKQVHRPLEPGDIAVLSRTWDPLDLYGQAIEECGIPILQAGGGNLLDTREAKDALALLQFLADPSDDLSLVAVLRSPFFAMSDPSLYALSQLPDAKTWWQRLKQSNDPAIAPALDVLSQLLREREAEPPTRLLQLADRLTGYTAVIANLPGCDRRMADWRGFIELVRRLEQGMADVLVVVRRLKRLISREVSVSRPPLAARNAVSLMTIHGAKGLEWPIVVVPDLARQAPINTPGIRLDPELGVSLKLADEDGEKHKSALYTLLEQRQKQQERAEAKRLLYVALTRARDRLILTAAKSDGQSLSLLQPGLEAGQLAIQPIPFDASRLRQLAPILPALPQLPELRLVESAHSGGLELPVTALTTYARCPKQFRLKYLDGHPGLATGISNRAAAIGSLTHKALEQKISTIDELQQYDRGLSLEQVQEALTLAKQFYESPTYSSIRQGAWEQSLQFLYKSLVFRGTADLVGDAFVLDIKTDQEMLPQEHRFQLWAYASAMDRKTAHIAYLRHNILYTFTASDLQQINHEAEKLMDSIYQGDCRPTPSFQSCQYCPYMEICEDRVVADQP